MSKSQNCPDCEGSGWTEEGWNKRDAGANPFAGDCKRCAGTGLEVVVDCTHIMGTCENCEDFQ